KHDEPSITQAELVNWVRETLSKTIIQETISNTLKYSTEILTEDIIINAKWQRQHKVIYPKLEEYLFE
ncbi:2647_t:CDS:1, partial [Acaulospora morrowiae]